MTKVNEVVEPIPKFESTSQHCRVRADGLRDIVLINYRNALHEDRWDSLTIPRDRALIGALADALELLARSEKMWAEL